MINAEGCKLRRERLWSHLDRTPDVIVVTDPRHLVYFAHYYPSPFVFRGEGMAAALVMTKDRCVLLADSNVRTFAESAFVDHRELPVWYDGVASPGPRKSQFVAHLNQLLASLQPKSIACEMSTFPVGSAIGVLQRESTADFHDIEPIIHRLKRAKDPDELATIETSVRAGEAGFQAARMTAEPGVSELELFTVIQAACQQAAGRQAMVYGDFVSGPRTQAGGGIPSTRIIQQGDLFLLDFSVVIDGYRGDFAATFACKAIATDRQRSAHAACLAGLHAGERLLIPGASCIEIDQAVRREVDSAGFGAYFRSHVGHGLGLGHPDPPYITSKSSDTLAVGDVVTLEPGVFIPEEWGIRIERNYVIEPGGARNLTQHDLGIDGV